MSSSKIKPSTKSQEFLDVVSNAAVISLRKKVKRGLKNSYFNKRSNLNRVI